GALRTDQEQQFPGAPLLHREASEGAADETRAAGDEGRGDSLFGDAESMTDRARRRLRGFGSCARGRGLSATRRLLHSNSQVRGLGRRVGWFARGGADEGQRTTATAVAETVPTGRPRFARRRESGPESIREAK